MIIKSAPKNQSAELLHTLLTNKSVTTRYIQQHLYILNVTSAMTALRHKGVQIVCDYVQTKNRYGRPVRYGKFNVLNKAESTKIYNQINKAK
jgi:hypothetical protein